MWPLFVSPRPTCPSKGEGWARAGREALGAASQQFPQHVLPKPNLRVL